MTYIQWSFGVLLWELLTRGAKPYEGIEPSRMRRYLKDGNRLAKPSPMTPDFVYVSTSFRLPGFSRGISVPFTRRRTGKHALTAELFFFLESSQR